jgi:hypothetical protein
VDRVLVDLGKTVDVAEPEASSATAYPESEKPIAVDA